MSAAQGARVYVASLSDYVDGRLHGVWVRADEGERALEEAVAAMLSASSVPGAEEWAIHDYEGFGSIALGEYESLARVAALAELLKTHGDAFGGWYANEDRGDLALEELGDAFADAYAGERVSAADYAQALAEDTGTVSSTEAWPLSCIDWTHAARELVLGGDIWTVSAAPGGVYVFTS